MQKEEGGQKENMGSLGYPVELLCLIRESLSGYQSCEKLEAFCHGDGTEGLRFEPQEGGKVIQNEQEGFRWARPPAE